MSELEDLRRDKDGFFAHHPQSPLTPEQRRRFTGLSYFPEDPSLVVEGVLQTDGVDREEPVILQTTTGDRQVYRRAGVVRFQVRGQQARITLFESDVQHELFVPFRDATSGVETYGAGRYLEVEPPGPDGRVVVDFNLAYNPYCAYNPHWSCPIPPAENHLAVPIRAGERSFPDAGEPTSDVG
jgi:hypothetical protein